MSPPCHLTLSSVRKILQDKHISTRQPTAAAVSSTWESKSADIVDKLVRAVGGKFNGFNFDIWRRTAQSVISMRHPEVVYIIEGQKCPEAIKIQHRGRTPARQSSAITRNRGQQQGAEYDTPARDEDEDREWKQQGEHQGSTPTSLATATSSQQVPAITAVPPPILWSMGSDIENAEEKKAWYKNNWMLYNFLLWVQREQRRSFFYGANPNQVIYRMDRQLGMS